MAVETGRSGTEQGGAALDALARAATLAAGGGPLQLAAAAVAEAAASATGAALAIVRLLDPDGRTVSARAVVPSGSALAAELEGTRVAVADLPAEPVADAALLPGPVRRSAERVGADAVLLVPAAVGGSAVGTLELMRSGAGFGPSERALARLAAAQLAVAARTRAGERGADGEERAGALELAGEALAAGSDLERAAQETVRIAADATRAAAAALWLGGPAGLALAAVVGVAPEDERLDAARARAALALAASQPLSLEAREGLPAGAARSATVQLGAPPLGALQLFYTAAHAPDEAELRRLTGFSVRAAHALRANGKARQASIELDRMRALLAVVGQAIARLSLAHTLETAIERIAELLAIERVAVYLGDGGRLQPAAERGVGSAAAGLAEQLLALALGPYRWRGAVVVSAAGPDADAMHDRVRAQLAAAELDSAVAVPLRVREDSIGLLAAYPARGRELSANELELLESLAAQLAVAVQNAQLHEQAKQLGDALGEALASERQAARQLRALYEISHSFAQSLSLETTLAAVTRTIVEVLEVDAAVIRVPDQRRDLLVPHAVHVADVRLADAVRTVLERPQPWSVGPIQRLFRTRKPLLLRADAAARLGGSHALLAPFLAKGSTAAVLPIATPADVLASLTILSLDPARPIGRETVDAALSIAGQAALAIDNARLYQQQKDFADTMQRSLLPDTQPNVPGIELGAVYESAATVAVGGDVYDYLELPDGRLAVAVGDVTGHGIGATADMAMARFLFRSLARQHPEPAEFLARANDVVVDEIAPGKFITMACVVVDADRGEAACSSAGHPEPRLLSPDGSVEAISAPGMALGIEPGLRFSEVRVPLPPGASIVLYTDGVTEARRERELYGTERLDAVLERGRGLSARELVRAVVDDCRAFGGELTDDVAVVAIRRTA